MHIDRCQNKTFIPIRYYFRVSLRSNASDRRDTLQVLRKEFLELLDGLMGDATLDFTEPGKRIDFIYLAGARNEYIFATRRTLLCIPENRYFLLFCLIVSIKFLIRLSPG